MKTSKQNLHKFFAGVILTAVLAALFGDVLLLPHPAQAQILTGLRSVPTEVTGGRLDTLNQQSISVSVLSNEIVNSAIVAAMNDAFRYFGSQMILKLEQKAGIKNLLYYQDALVEAKYLTDAFRKTYGEEAVPQGTRGDVSNLAGTFENYNLSRGTVSPQQAVRISRQSDPRSREVKLSQLIVGATALFTPSISCAGVNQMAVQNTAEYLALESAGFLASEIRPESGATFYEQMARLGNPAATAPYWVMQFQDGAAQNEARARQAASLELIAPGLKSSQKRDASGSLAINQSLNFYTGQQNANINALFESGIFKAKNSMIPSGSLKQFAIYLAAVKSGDYASRALGALLGSFGKIIGKQIEQSAWFTGAKTYAGFVASTITKAIVRSLFDQMIVMAFQGQILGESGQCRKPVQTADFKSDIDTKAPIPGTDQTSTAGDESGIFFIVEPELVVRGETDPTITITWDASVALGSECPAEDRDCRQTRPKVMLNIVNSTNVRSKEVGVSGQETDTISETTEYILSVSGSSVNASVKRVVIMETPPEPEPEPEPIETNEGTEQTQSNFISPPFGVRE